MFWTQCVTDGRTLTQCLINTPILFVWSRCEKSSSSLITTRRNIQRLWSVNLWLSLIILRKYVMFRFWSDEQKDLVWIHIHMNQGGGVCSERSALVLAAVSDRTGVFSLLGFFCGRHLIGPESARSLRLLGRSYEQIWKDTKKKNWMFLLRVVLRRLLPPPHTLLSEVQSEYM